MIYLFITLLFFLLIPSIHYGTVVDERDGVFKGFNWNPRTWILSLRRMCYGAGLTKCPKIDRLSLIVTHCFVVWSIWHCFGESTTSLLTAALWATSPMTVFVAIWRNGRRYNLSNLLALWMWKLGAWGVFIYPMVTLFQVSAVPAIFLYLITDQWWISLTASVLVPLAWDHFGIQYKFRKGLRPDLYTKVRPEKVIVVIKTLGYFVYNTIVPQRAFMYSGFMQQLGSTTYGTRRALKKDKMFWFGFVCLLSLPLLVWNEPTRFGAFWFVLFFIPYSNIIILHQFNNVRYALLPAIGIYYMMAAVLPWQGLLVFTALNVTKLIVSMEQFMCDEFMYRYHFDHRPKTIAPYLIMGKHYVSQGQHSPAIEVLREGLKHHPRHWGMMLILSACGTSDQGHILKRLEVEMPCQTFATQEKLRQDLDHMKGMIRRAKKRHNR